MAIERRHGVYVPKGADKKHVPMVGPGISVWAIIGYSALHKWDMAKVLSNWDGYLTEDDVLSAWEFYKEHPATIDDKLRRNEADDLDPEEWGLA